MSRRKVKIIMYITAANSPEIADAYADLDTDLLIARAFILKKSISVFLRKTGTLSAKWWERSLTTYALHKRPSRL